MDEKKLKKFVGFVQEQDIALFDELTDISDSLENIAKSLNGVKLSKLDTIKGEPGERGEDGIGIDGLDGLRGSIFLGKFDSVEELPEEAEEGDWALVDGEIWQA